MKQEWTSPEVEEFDIAERTQIGEGVAEDGVLTNGFNAGGGDGGDGGASS
jgi:hypothetical protein